MKGRILFIGPHRPNRNGSQRFRMEQFFPYLEEVGYMCDYSWFISENDDRILYRPGHFAGKLRLFVKAFVIRMRDVIRAGRYDIIFIQREAFMTGSTFFEKWFEKSKSKVIFDFDDAIWLEDISSSNRRLRWLKRPGKTTDIIRMADHIIAGNSFLSSYARQFNERVSVIPTVVDTRVFAPGTKRASEPVCIGWSGSRTTVKHFALIVPVLKQLQEKFHNHIRLLQIGDSNYRVPGLQMESLDWNFDKELERLRSIDIGLMPLPDDEWSNGKCGFKAIQYMSLAIPAVISPVGMNSEIIQHGVNGFFATTEDEWIKIVSDLVLSEPLRREIGRAGRETIVHRYSVESQFPVLKGIIERLLGSD